MTGRRTKEKPLFLPDLKDPLVQQPVRELASWYEEWGYNSQDVLTHFNPSSMINLLRWREQHSVHVYE